MIRLYRKETPELDDIVIVKIESIADTEIKVELQGYNQSGWIQRKQLVPHGRKTNRKPLNRLVKVGLVFPAQVIEFGLNGAITLSKIRVDEEECSLAIESWQHEKRAFSIMNQIARQIDMDVQDLYRTLGWRLQDEYTYTMNAFELMRTQTPQSYPDYVEEHIRPVIQSILDKMFLVREVVLFSEVEVYSTESLEFLKDAFRTALEDSDILTKSVSSPLYRLELKTLVPEQDSLKMTRVLDRLIEQQSSRFKVCVKTHPKTIATTS